MSSFKVGCYEQVAPNKAPLLTAGDITPEALRAWEMGCYQFFWQKEVVEKEQVKKVAWNLQDPRVQDWYSNDCERLNALTFSAFMKEVQSYWLCSDWATIVRQRLLLSTQGDKPFHVWAAETQSQNDLLRGDPSHLSDEAIRYHLESHMHPDLMADYRSVKVDKEEDLRTWIDRVRSLDEKRLRDVAHMEVAAIRANKHQPLQASRTANLKETKSSTEGKAHPQLPALTTEERTLLRDNSGCFKCRQFFQNHTTPMCPNNFPDVNGYTTLTAADVEAARTKKRVKPVTAVSFIFKL